MDGEVGIAALRLCGPALFLLAFVFRVQGIGGRYTPPVLLTVGLDVAPSTSLLTGLTLKQSVLLTGGCPALASLLVRQLAR